MTATKKKQEFDRRLLKSGMFSHTSLSESDTFISPIHCGNGSMQKNNISPAGAVDCLYIRSMLGYLRSGECVCVV